ncbi:MAG TPA: YezD family protein [Sphingobium sp.]|nr:YezD family protein [Sphingobium sp.]
MSDRYAAAAGGSEARRNNAEEAIETVRQALRALRFGAVTLTVHDARVVQVDVTEKQRF